MFNIERFIRENPEEFENLLELFQNIKENYEDKIQEELWLGEILMCLNQPKEPIEFFLRVIEPSPNTYLFKYGSEEHRIEAASYLVQLNYNKGKQFLRELIKKDDAETKSSIRGWLFQSRNRRCCELLLEFIENGYIENECSDLSVIRRRIEELD